MSNPRFPRNDYYDSSAYESTLSAGGAPNDWADTSGGGQAAPTAGSTPTTIGPDPAEGVPTTNISSRTRIEDRQPPFAFITNPTINSILVRVNPELLVSKLFYFFFYSAFGSLFPLMAVYFKQLGMNPIQAGTLIGIRPFVEFIAAPFWSSIADRFHKCKAILLFSLVCWILFTFSLAFIRPPASACVIFNETHHILYTPYSDEIDESDLLSNGGANLWPTESAPPGVLGLNESTIEPVLTDMNQVMARDKRDEAEAKEDEAKGDKESVGKWGTKHRPPPNHVVGKSPMAVDYTLNYNHEKHGTYLSPPFSTIVYKLEDVKEVFFLLLLLVLLGEFFSAPAISLADTATLNYLGDETDRYGQQRMYGSIGWAISMLLVGIALDNSTHFKDHPCGPHSGERNYVTCFSIFAFLMSCTLFIATKFGFEEHVQEYSNEMQLSQYDYESSGPKPWQNTAPAINVPKQGPGAPAEANKKLEFIDRWKSAVFAQRAKGLPQWVAVLRSMNNAKQISFLFITWFMGFGVGLVFTFLFWHLQDLGGTPTLYGLASVINHISEIGAYFFSIQLIKKFGHSRVLCVGLACNAARFIYVAWLDNPWWVLPFELIQGVTHASVWAAACSYITQNTEPELRVSAQGVMQGVYQGLGRGSGSILGGVIINRFGSRVAFFLYGLLCAAVLGLFVHVNYYRGKEEGYRFEEDNTQNCEIVLNDSSALAPHGVPTNPIGRSVSRQNFGATQSETSTPSRPNAAPANAWGDGTNNAAPQDYYDPNEAWN